MPGSKPSPEFEEIRTKLSAYQYRYSCEKELQDGLEKVLQTMEIEHVREHSLSPTDKVDFFLLSSIALEVKIQESLTAVTRQLHRYAQHPEVKELLLVTTKSSHRAVAEEMNKKPVRVLYLGLGAL